MDASRQIEQDEQEGFRAASSRSGPRSFFDWYAMLLMGVLLGYVFIGKGFAYQGVPPLLVGEVTLLAGALCYATSGVVFATLSTVASRFLAVLMLWVVLRKLVPTSVFETIAPMITVN